MILITDNVLDIESAKKVFELKPHYFQLLEMNADGSLYQQFHNDINGQIVDISINDSVQRFEYDAVIMCSNKIIHCFQNSESQILIHDPSEGSVEKSFVEIRDIKNAMYS